LIEDSELVIVKLLEKPGPIVLAEATIVNVLADKIFKLEKVTVPEELVVPVTVPDILPPGLRYKVIVSDDALDAVFVPELSLKVTVTSKLVELLEG